MRFLADAIALVPDPRRDLIPYSWDGYGAANVTIHHGMIGLYSKSGRHGPLISDEMALERALQRGTAANAEAHTGTTHEPMPLYTMAEDCPHHEPDAYDIADGLDELIDAEHERRHPGDSYSNTGYYERHGATADLFIQERLLRLMQEIYDDNHSNVCYLEPQGSCCMGCTEGDDEDGGHEPGPCYRQSTARDDMAEFWYFQGDANNRKDEEA